MAENCTNVPLLSIIIPVYKVEPYLQDCLECLVQSTSVLWEAIIIDDGSPDNCPYICDIYAERDARIHVYHHSNQGVSVARNKGIENASGHWLWFVDSDDLVNLDCVDCIVDSLRKSDTDLIAFPILSFVDGDRPYIEKTKHCYFDGSLEKDLFLNKYVCFHHQCIWYKRTLVNQYDIRFTKGIKVGEDLEFLYRYLTICHQPTYCLANLYYYRERCESVTRVESYRTNVIKDLPIVLNNLADWIQTQGIIPSKWLNMRIRLLFQNYLYSASLIDGICNKDIQRQARIIMNRYKSLDFSFVNELRYVIAKKSVGIYFILNKLYLFLKTRWRKNK